MTTNRDAPVPVRCPRCGGPMYKPAGSSLYWHENSKHPPCDITNITEVSLADSLARQALNKEEQQSHQH